VPSISLVAILWNPDHVDPEFRETKLASQSLGVELISLQVWEPADLPMEQPAAFNLNLNLSAAKRLGIRVPESVPARADKIID